MNLFTTVAFYRDKWANCVIIAGILRFLNCYSFLNRREDPVIEGGTSLANTFFEESHIYSILGEEGYYEVLTLNGRRVSTRLAARRHGGREAEFSLTHNPAYFSPIYAQPLDVCAVSTFYDYSTVPPQNEGQGSSLMESDSAHGNDEENEAVCLESITVQNTDYLTLVHDSSALKDTDTITNGSASNTNSSLNPDVNQACLVFDVEEFAADAPATQGRINLAGDSILDTSDRTSLALDGHGSLA